MVPKFIAYGEGNPEKASIESAKLAKIEPTSAEITKQLNEIASKIKQAKKEGKDKLVKKLEDRYDALGDHLKIIHELNRGKHVFRKK